MSINEIVAEALVASGAKESTLQIWFEVYEGFDAGGPEAVKRLLAAKVRELQRQAEKEVKAVRSAASAVSKPKRGAKRRRS